MVRFTVDSKGVVRNLKKHAKDFEDPNGVLAREIKLGMNEVFDRVNNRFKKLYVGARRRYIDANAGFRDKAAPRVVKSRIVDSIQSDKRANYYIKTSKGFFTFGLGNVEDLDKLTEETIISDIKAARQEVPEQTREFPGRTIHSIWRIIEFGAKPHPISPIAGAGSPYVADPYYGGGLMFFSHKKGSISFADRTFHPGQSGKHVFLRTEHEIYQSDVGAISKAIHRGLKKQHQKYHGTKVR